MNKRVYDPSGRHLSAGGGDRGQRPRARHVHVEVAGQAVCMGRIT